MTRILVTGADGQLGRSLRELAARSTGLASYVFLDRAQLDITQAGQVDRCLDAGHVDCLINAAAYTAVDRAALEPERAMAVNAHAPGQLALACARRNMRLIHVSTDYVFDGRLDRPYRETDPVAPLNTYGRSKCLGEQAVLQADPQAVILRTGWVFSAWGTNFVRGVLQRGRSQAVLRVVDDQWGGPTWAGHLAQAAQALAVRPAGTVPGGLYHFGGRPWTNRYEFADEIIERAHACGLLPRRPRLQAISSAHWAATEPRPANSRLDCARLEALLGPLERDWRSGLDRVLAGLQSQLSATL
jgi:dTDP-4-dehydrorhamnose reductase